MRVITLTFEAVEALKKGESIWVDLGDFVCELRRYDLAEDIAESLFPKIIVEPDYEFENQLREDSDGLDGTSRG